MKTRFFTTGERANDEIFGEKRSTRATATSVTRKRMTNGPARRSAKRNRWSRMPPRARNPASLNGGRNAPSGQTR